MGSLSDVLVVGGGVFGMASALELRAREGWLRWNAEIFDEPLYHEIDLLKLTRAPMSPGTYEYENYRSLLARGYELERLTQRDIAQRFPAWNSELYVDGYLNPVRLRHSD